MKLWALFYLRLIVSILGESRPTEPYDLHGYPGESQDRGIEEDTNNQFQNSRFSNSGTEKRDTERPTSTPGIIDPEFADQLEGNGWLDVIPGTPGKDYPNYARIPETSFTCNGKTPGGYYADIEARCQVFHVCNTGGEKSSFLCPSGSIFNQKYFVCDWWYDFECDDATDLYSLNEKVNRGGTGSGPSGPGRIEETVEYSLNNENFHQEDLRNQRNFVSGDGYDLSLAGTGEGGPGYVRTGNKGYQSNVNDENHDVKHGNDMRQTSQRNYPTSMNKKNGSNKNRNEESAIFPNTKENREHFRKENSTLGNPGGNYQNGYRNVNSNGGQKIHHFRTGYREENNHGEKSNGFNENSHRHRDTNFPNQENTNTDFNYPQRDAQKYEETNDRNESKKNFGQRSFENGESDRNRGSSSSSSSSGFDKKEFSNSRETEDQKRKNIEEYNSDENPGSSSESNNNEYRIPFGSKPSNIRGRQRTNGGLPRGLGNGYPSPAGSARELPGSDNIARSITTAGGTLYDQGNRSDPLNSQHKTSSFTRTTGELTDIEDIAFLQPNRKPDFREDRFSQERDPRNGQLSKNRKYSGYNSSLGNSRSFESSHRHESHGQINDQIKKNTGNDYLIGIVPGAEDRGNGTFHSNQSRRFLPIL